MGKIVISIIVVFLFVGTLIILHKRAYQKNLDYCFKGEVEAIRYDVKNTPYVTINVRTFFLSYNNWDFNTQIQIGDSLEKEKGTMTIRLVKKYTGKIVFFGD